MTALSPGFAARFSRLASLAAVDVERIGDPGHDLGCVGRWQVYREAIRLEVGRDDLFRLVGEEPDPGTASAIVVGMLERIDDADRDRWIGQLPENHHAFPRRRLAELRLLERLLRGAAPPVDLTALDDWSDWLQRRMAATAADAAALRALAAGGRTRRVRHAAAQRLRGLS